MASTLFLTAATFNMHGATVGRRQLVAAASRRPTAASLLSTAAALLPPLFFLLLVLLVLLLLSCLKIASSYRVASSFAVPPWPFVAHRLLPPPARLPRL